MRGGCCAAQQAAWVRCSTPPSRKAEFKRILAARARIDEAPGSATGEGISGNAVSPYEFGGNDMSTHTVLMSFKRRLGRGGPKCADVLWVPCAVDGGAGEWESISTPAFPAFPPVRCDAWTEITEGDLSQQLASLHALAGHLPP